MMLWVIWGLQVGFQKVTYVRVQILNLIRAWMGTKTMEWVAFISDHRHITSHTQKNCQIIFINKMYSIWFALIIDCVNRGLVCLWNVCLFLFVFIFQFVSPFDLSFELLFLQCIIVYLHSIATVTQHTGCNFLLTLIYLINNSKTVGIIIFTGPGLISLLHLDPLQE